MKCKYCDCPYNYYINCSHASRPSCLVSPNKYHYFDTSLNILISKIFTIINLFKIKC